MSLLCKPNEIRPNCVAHPKFKERQLLKPLDDRCEPIPLSVKPVELRKRLSSDLEAKQDASRPLVYPDVFLKYATLYRTHFGKDRQSVMEGLVDLTELPRRQVLKRLESAIKRTRLSRKSGPGRPSTHDERVERRRHDAERGDEVTGTTAGVNGAGSESKNSNQKRNRPFPLTPESLLEAERVKLSNQAEAQEDPGAGMTREERKVMREMALFRRLEERDKKKPRLGEVSGSPRVNPTVGPLSNAQSGSAAPSFSVKSPQRMPTTSEPSPTSSMGDAQKEPVGYPSPSPRDSSKTAASVAFSKRDRSKDRKDSRRKEVRIS